ncbi:hypothetical protein BH24PSE2_BH24PSE2_04030 [soil metagenome]
MTPPRKKNRPKVDRRAPSGQTEPNEYSSMREIVERVSRITLENEQLFQRLIDGERRFRGLAKAVWKVQEEERRRLARDLHDGIGQTLVALHSQLERLSTRANGNPELVDGLQAASELTRLALNDTRELSRLLRPPVLDDLGLSASLSWLARTMEESTGLRVELNSELEDERFDPDLETLVFRVVQEALTNTVKHADSATAQVRVEKVGGDLRVQVRDTGVGFDIASAFGEGNGAEGCGLRGIRDRLELFGGNLELVTAPSEGCILKMRVPCRTVAAAELPELLT